MKKLNFLSVIILSILFRISLIGQTENKTLNLTVSGYGKTQQEALTNALRNAIEEAFGTFISSNTQILNDALVKDEIISISSGNIQNYSITSEEQTPDGNWSNTVNAKVFIDKLTSFCESKGVTIEFKGALFALNIKQQELNKQNEEKAINNMCIAMKELSENCFDFEIKADEPKASNKKQNSWDIPITIYASPNNNLKTLSEYFCTTLKALSLSSTDMNDYKKLGIKTFSFRIIQDKSLVKSNKKNKKQLESNSDDSLTPIIILRSSKSISTIENIIQYFHKSLLNFQISNNIDIKLGYDFVNSVNGQCKLKIKDLGFKPGYIVYDWDQYKFINEIIQKDIENGSMGASISNSNRQNNTREIRSIMFDYSHLLSIFEIHLIQINLKKLYIILNLILKQISNH